MTSRKGQNVELRNNQKANGKGSPEEYEINYYGDETFLKIDSFENEKNILQARISVLEWRIKAMGISGIVLLIFSLGILAFSFFHQLEIDETGRQISSLWRSENRIQRGLDNVTAADTCYHDCFDTPYINDWDDPIDYKVQDG